MSQLHMPNSKSGSDSGNVYLSYPTELAISSLVRLRLSTQADTEHLLKWTKDRAVFTWWEGRPLERGEVEAKYTGKRAPDVIAYIIEQDNKSAGYIQAWQEEGKRGLDMFLSTKVQGHGIGVTVARGLANDLTARGWTNLSVDPAIDNERAIRAWSKAGFKATGEFGEDGGHRTQIMVFDVRN